MMRKRRCSERYWLRVAKISSKSYHQRLGIEPYLFRLPRHVGRRVTLRGLPGPIVINEVEIEDEREELNSIRWTSERIAKVLQPHLAYSLSQAPYLDSSSC